VQFLTEICEVLAKVCTFERRILHVFSVLVPEKGRFYGGKREKLEMFNCILMVNFINSAADDVI